MEYLDKIDTDIYEPGTIRVDKPSSEYTWTDARGKKQSIDAGVSFGANMEAALGANYGGKMAGSLWEAAWKTGASFIPAGGTWKAAIGYTLAKIGAKSVGTAGNYIASGQYKADKAVKKALLINAFTPSNYAPVLGSAKLENTIVGKTFGSYYGFINGNGKSTNFFQKNRLDYIDIHSIHKHGTLYPINFLAQAETKVVGYGIYNVISGNHPHEVAQSNQIHNNDIQYRAMTNSMAGQQGFNVVPNPASGLNVNLHVFDAEPRSGGQHDSGEYEGAFLPWSVEATRELANYFSNNLTEPMEKAESGISKEHEIWKHRVSRAEGVIDTGIEIAKGFPDALDRLDKLGLIYANRYFAVPILSTLSSGINEAVIALDKSGESLANYALAAGNFAYAKIASTVRAIAGDRAPAPLGESPFEELQVLREVNGKKISVYVSKVRQDATQVKTTVPPKLLINAKKTQKEADDAAKTLMGLNRNLYNMNANRESQIAAQAAIYGQAGRPKNTFSGNAPFSAGPNNNSQIRTGVPVFNNSNRTTVSELRK